MLLINTKIIIKNKLKDFLGESKKIKVQTFLVLEYKDGQQSMQNIFHSSPKLIVNNSDIDKALASMHQSIMTKIKNFVSEDWNVKTIVEHAIRIFEC